MSRGRTLLLVVLLALGVLLLAALLLPLLVDKDRLVALAGSAVREQTGAELRVDGPVDIGLLPTLGVALGDVSLTRPGQEEAELQVDSLRLGVRLLPLLFGRLQVNSLELRGLTARLPAQHADGSQPEGVTRRPAGQGAAGGDVIALPLALDVGRLRVLDSRLELPAGDGAQRRAIDIQRFEVRDFNLAGAPITLEGRLRLPGDKPVDIALEGSVRIDGQRQVVALDPLQVDADGLAAGPVGLAARGDVDLRQRSADLTVDPAVLAGHRIEDLHLLLSADDGLVRLQSVTGRVHGGDLRAQGSFDGRNAVAALHSDGSLTGLDVAAALEAAGKPPLASGRADLNWRLAARGRGSRALLEDLHGPVHLDTTNLILQDIGIEGLLCQAVALTNRESLSTRFPDATTVERLTADIRLARGQAVLAPLQLALAHISLKGTGRYDLLSRDFDLDFAARLSPELETVDRACRVSKRLTAIDWPVNCRGNLDGKPADWCRVDTEQVIEDLATDEVQRKLEKKAGKLLDKLFNKD